MRNIFTIVKKEFNRFFRDPRMLFVMVLPGLLIYLVYSLMGGAFSDMMPGEVDTSPFIQVVNLPESFSAIAEKNGIAIIELADHSMIDDLKTDISKSKGEFLLIFPANFDHLVEAYDLKTSSGSAPSIEIYYNSTSANSSVYYETVRQLLDQYETTLVNKFNVGGFDLADEQNLAGTIIGAIMPLLLMEFLLVGCVSVAPESIAGEKERGTIATLLVTPIKRGQLALGKILSLSVIAVLCGLITTAGTILSLPKLLNLDQAGIEVAYSATQYLMLLGVIVSTTLLLITLISILSAYAKTVKEATQLVSPVMILVMVLALVSMLGGGSTSSLDGLIPIYNSAVSFGAIFSVTEGMTTTIILSIISNLAYACLGGFVLTRMFMSERVIFNK